MRYLVIIEESNTGYAAYSPDLEGCVATGATIDEVEATMREAVEFHIDTAQGERYRSAPTAGLRHLRRSRRLSRRSPSTVLALSC